MPESPTAGPTGPEPLASAAPAGGLRSLATLVTDLLDQAERLVRAEIALAKAEVTARLQQAGIGLGLLVVAGVLAFFMAATAIATAILGLATVLPAWLAALIVTVALLLLTALLGWLGVNRLKAGVPPAPTKAQASLKTDVETVKGAFLS